ncbi:hypothetical protein ACJX0J_025127, partial [Zea mays]
VYLRLYKGEHEDRANILTSLVNSSHAGDELRNTENMPITPSSFVPFEGTLIIDDEIYIEYCILFNVLMYIFKSMDILISFFNTNLLFTTIKCFDPTLE